MKHLKTYENRITDEPQIGDYVVVSVRELSKNDNYVFVIGKIYDKERYYVFVEYKFSNQSMYYRITYDIDELLFRSKDKKDCEIYLSAKKYNL